MAGVKWDQIRSYTIPGGLLIEPLLLFNPPAPPPSPYADPRTNCDTSCHPMLTFIPRVFGCFLTQSQHILRGPIEKLAKGCGLRVSLRLVRSLCSFSVGLPDDCNLADLAKLQSHLNIFLIILFDVTLFLFILIKYIQQHELLVEMR